MKKVKNFIQRKSLIYKTNVEYGDYTINHVQGCGHGCKYPCYASLKKSSFFFAILTTFHKKIDIFKKCCIKISLYPLIFTYYNICPNKNLPIYYKKCAIQDYITDNQKNLYLRLYKVI